MQSALDAALEGVAQAGRQAQQARLAAEREAAEYREQALEWKRKYNKEKELREALNAEFTKSRGTAVVADTCSGCPPLPPLRSLSFCQKNKQNTHSSILRRSTVPPSTMVKWTESTSSPTMPILEPTQPPSLSTTLAAYLLLAKNQSSAISSQSQNTESHSTVSVADDGRSGVGAAAAAAVSVALAQSWAAVAGGGKSHDLLPTSSTPVHPNKARFKLVAAVPRSVYKSQSQHALHKNGNNRSIQSDLALESIDDANELDDTQEATWRASGSHLKLHWLSAPWTVLVVHKPTSEVLEATAHSIAWLLRKGITVYVEPEVFDEIRSTILIVLEDYGAASGPRASTSSSPPAVQQQQQQKQNTPSSIEERSSSTGSVVFGESEPLSPSCEAKAEAEEAARQHHANAASDNRDLLSRLLTTWTPDHSCDGIPIIPNDVALRIDLVLTLGGDGTVLWACSLFGSGSVPPVVAVAMGSLGFMTPFPLNRMESVLSRVTSVAHGFPLMLRHRLRCRIIRAGTVAASTADFSTIPETSPYCEDILVLNEVVIDRGMTASLANLQCYVDRNFVTTIQGDGLIVSTPTGSTAYNLAAGGSMVHPSVPCILFTPICAHTLSSRPLVFPEHVTLRVKVPIDSRAEAYLSFDGRGRQVLKPGDSLMIHISQWPVPMVCNLDSSHDWFLSVREGLHWNRRVPQKALY